MTRLARQWRVLFWEEPVACDDAARLVLRVCPHSGVTIATPHLPVQADSAAGQAALKAMLDTHLTGAVGPLVRWYYTPMMLPFSRHLAARCTVYDCMDELSAFQGAPTGMVGLESELLDIADLVFTGGRSLCAAKRDRHPAVHCFPSSVDAAHFGRARAVRRERPAPVLGYYGVIDDRVDLGLIAGLADARPDWTIEMVGPIVKIDPATVPNRPNLVWPGQQAYADLPDWLGRWNVALMPFALNAATQFISPTKTPEYLAGGRPVVSTPIADVVADYGDLAGVAIAGDAALFVASCEAALAIDTDHPDWLAHVDARLADMSWDMTVASIRDLIAPMLRPVEARVRGKADYDVLIVGAGFAGAVMAERLAADAGKRVLVVDKRPHVAGNAYDRRDAHGILIHQYGPHIFHTNAQEIFAYLSRFTEWRPYEHRVLADVRGRLVPVPINRTTLNTLYDAGLRTDDEAAAFLAARAEPIDPVRTSEDVVVSQVGRELYELFFRGYTRKQWGLDPSQLDKAVTARVPTRTGTDDRYFADRFQAMPLDGFTAMFERMLDHPGIDVVLGLDFAEARSRFTYEHLVYTGPIDEYFDHRFGRLPYRSLRFEHSTVQSPQYQPVAVVNYPSPTVPYTRITEYKHLTGQVAPVTSLTHEYPSDVGDPYYPVPRAENQELYKRYEALAAATPDVTFVGRLATYRYYNMDQIVGQALATYRRMKARIGTSYSETRQFEAAS